MTRWTKTYLRILSIYAGKTYFCKAGFVILYAALDSLDF
jgi:hypothetical protein